MSAVDVSVVMGVFNGAGTLEATLASVLGQEGVDLEFVVIDDGSTDGTSAILNAWSARDARLRVFRQPNAGLTRALARGCAEARGRYIARQDCGDTSLPGRLARQCSFLKQHPQAAMVACAARFVGPADEPLFVTARPGEKLHEGLSILEIDGIVGPPHHGGTMYPRATYEEAGGYRAAFVVAQDIDLWLRLAELGQCVGEPDVGYEARMEMGSLSARLRTDQIRFATLAIECARLRRKSGDDSALLDRVHPERVTQVRRNERLERARFLYFVGSCLRRTDPAAARRYYWQSFREHPLLVKSLIRFALG
jgi:glycosyltransferase involved in cell wall biosynthesis